MYYINRFYRHSFSDTIFVIWEVKSIAPRPVSKNVDRIIFIKKIKDDYDEFLKGYRIVDDKKKIVKNSEDVIKEIFK